MKEAIETVKPIMATILVLGNSSSGIYDFRNGLLLRLLRQGHRVVCALPEEDRRAQMEAEGCIYELVTMRRHGMNPLQDLALYQTYRALIRKYHPSLVLTYTIKPNVYGGVACAREGVPCMATVTGLGTTFQRGGAVKAFATILYRVGLKKDACVYFQNEENMEIFRALGIRGKKARLVNGSGVDLAHHTAWPYPGTEAAPEKTGAVPKTGEAAETAAAAGTATPKTAAPETATPEAMTREPAAPETAAVHPQQPLRAHATGAAAFLYVGRLMRDKGSRELMEAAIALRERYGERIHLTAVGYSDDTDASLDGLVREAEEKGVLTRVPYQADIRPYLRESDIVVMPSYHEGMSNVIMEAAATARPVIATDISGCRELVEDGATGLLVPARDKEALQNAMERVLSMPRTVLAEMGLRGRDKMERSFDRQCIIDGYMEEINAFI